MKNDFLTIPDFPNYEINSELIVRNKTTGKVLSSDNVNKAVGLRNNGKRFFRRVTFLWQSVKTQHLDWVKVPSLNYLFEVNIKGQARNALTKKMLKLQIFNRVKGYRFYISGRKRVFRSVNNLLWECHGIIPRLKRNLTPIPVTIKKDKELFFFESLKKCSCFLSKRVFRSPIRIIKLLSRRMPEVYGWNITYHKSDDLSEIKTPRRKWKHYD